MKTWSLIGFIVLVLSSVCRGLDNNTTNSTQDETHDVKDPTGTFTTRPTSLEVTNEGHDNTSVTPSPPSNQAPSSGNNTTNETETDIWEETTEQTTVIDIEEGTVTVTTDTVVTTDYSTGPLGGDTTSNSNAGGDTTSNSNAAYVILVLIILVIIVLCTILYLLRRASRSYSFDLQRPPVTHSNQPTGTFEAVYLDERPDLKDHVTDDVSPPPVANGGTNQEVDENSNSDETDSQEQQPDSNGVEAPPTNDITTQSGDGPDEKTSDPPSSNDLMFDAVVEQQNENNNNPSVCSSDPFVEINLDEPAWCGQLLNSPPANSFSPFSFSSSSSTSS